MNAGRGSQAAGRGWSAAGIGRSSIARLIDEVEDPHENKGQQGNTPHAQQQDGEDATRSAGDRACGGGRTIVLFIRPRRRGASRGGGLQHIAFGGDARAAIAAPSFSEFALAQGHTTIPTMIHADPPIPHAK